MSINALVAKRQTQPPQKRPPQGMEVQILPGAPTVARFAKRPRHRSYTPTFPGSSPGASTRHRFVSLAAKHLLDMQGTRGSSPRRSTSISPVAQRQSARPITGRPRIVTVRENQTQEVQHDDDDQKTGAAGRRISIADGPGAFKLEMVGQRTFNPCAKRFNSSRVPQPHDHHTRLAQLVRAPSS